MAPAANQIKTYNCCHVRNLIRGSKILVVVAENYGWGVTSFWNFLL